MPSTAVERLPEIRQRVETSGRLSPELTDWLLRARFSEIPNRLGFALESWPLQESRVLDIGCSFGHCLAHFGPGSLGADNVPRHVDFCRSIGLDAVLLDADVALDGIPDGAFDYIWVSDILEHLDAPRLLLRRLTPKLAEDGRLLVYISLRPRNRLVREALRRKQIVPYRAATHYYQFTLETARYLVERAGYGVSGVSVPALRGPLRRFTPLLVRNSPTVIIEAQPDAAAQATLDNAERKNKP